MKSTTKDLRNDNMSNSIFSQAISPFAELTGSFSLTDSIRVPQKLCPSYAVTHRLQTQRKLMDESPVAPRQGRGLEIVVLASMLALITVVSMIDVYWSFKTQAILAETEQNPLGKWLIDKDGGDISLFMTLKMAGTMGVILAIPALYFFRRSWGMICASALSLFQAGLLIYFYIGHELFPAG